MAGQGRHVGSHNTDGKRLLGKRSSSHEAVGSRLAATFMLDQDYSVAGSLHTRTQLLQTHSVGSATPLDRVAAYGRAVMLRSASAILALALANFQGFLFLSCCAVLATPNRQENLPYSMRSEYALETAQKDIACNP